MVSVLKLPVFIGMAGYVRRRLYGNELGRSNTSLWVLQKRAYQAALRSVNHENAVLAAKNCGIAEPVVNMGDMYVVHIVQLF